MWDESLAQESACDVYLVVGKGIYEVTEYTVEAFPRDPDDTRMVKYNAHCEVTQLC